MTAVMVTIGNLRNHVERIRTIFLIDMDMLTSEDASNSALVNKIPLFLSSLDGAHVQAGSTFVITHSFLFKFYGLIVTYIAVLVSISSL